MNGRAAPGLQPAILAEHHRRLLLAYVWRKKAHILEWVGYQWIVAVRRFAPYGETVIRPRAELQPGLPGLFPRQECPLRVEDAGCAAEQLAQHRAGLRTYGWGPGCQAGHFVAPPVLVCTERRQQACQNDEIGALRKEPLELERRIAERGVQSNRTESHDRHGGGPECAACLPPECRSHNGKNEVGEERARGAFGQIHKHREEREIDRVRQQTDPEACGVAEPSDEREQQRVAEIAGE